MSAGNRSRTLILCLGCFLLAFFVNMRIFNDGAPGWKHIVTSDGRGYYAYLPALLLDHDPTFSTVVKRETKLLSYRKYKPGYLEKSGKLIFNKYFTGEAVLLLPFFLAGTLFSWIFGMEIDGYSFFFQLFAGLGALFYLLLGLTYLLQILGHLRIRQEIAFLAIILILLGTNLFYYSLWQPTMSHVYSFFLINGFMWFSIRATREWNTKNALFAGLFFGLTVLTRPTNSIILLLIPFLAGNREQLMIFITSFWKRKRATLMFFMLVSAILLIQVAAWYIQTGNFFLWSYRHEGFRFFSPEFMNVLFSYRKGLFVYTPLILVSLGGLVILLVRNRLQFFSMALFLATALFIIASWWNWYYGDGFGLRAFIDYYGIFAILLALLLNTVRFRPALAGFVSMLAVLALFNLLQTWQYTHMVIQPNSMNREKYQSVFLRTDSAAVYSLGGNQEIADYNIDQVHPVKVLFNNFETKPGNWKNLTAVSTPAAFSGKKTGYLDSLNQFSSGVSIRASQLGKFPGSLYVEGDLMVWDSVKGASNTAMVVLSMDSITPGENWWQGFRLNDVPVQTIRQWRKISFSLMTPEIGNPAGILKIYIWTTGKKPLLIDDFRIKIYGTRDNTR
ncbi:MAG: hypothetical protein WCO44_08530 [Bacteroidota bacterium]